mmetsp:Transcript_65288/g.151489  ORF Transcript_65288/g.151489 Transcript_65288/m.151489 type:complete len:86 (-) Transcript_65288:49-306(-)
MASAGKQNGSPAASDVFGLASSPRTGPCRVPSKGAAVMRSQGKAWQSPDDPDDAGVQHPWCQGQNQREFEDSLEHPQQERNIASA